MITTIFILHSSFLLSRHVTIGFVTQRFRRRRPAFDEELTRGLSSGRDRE